jgi:hypothetical protein
MASKFKNIITNLIGLKLIGIDIYCYFYHDHIGLGAFLTILCVALALFLFKGDQTKEWIQKALTKIISK